MSLDWPALIQLLDTKFRHQSDEMVALHQRISNLEMECTRKDIEILQLKEALKEAIQQQLPSTAHAQSATPLAPYSLQKTQSATAPNIPAQQVQQTYATFASMMSDRAALGIPSDNFDCHIKSCLKPGSDFDILSTHLTAKHCGATVAFPTELRYIPRCEKGKLKCPECDVSYSYAGTLKNHYLENHVSNVVPAVSVPANTEHLPLVSTQDDLHPVSLDSNLALEPKEHSANSTTPIKAQMSVSKGPSCPPAKLQDSRNHQSLQVETPQQKQALPVQSVYRNAPVLLKDREHLGIPVTNNRCHMCVTECTSRKALYNHLWARHADGILVLGPDKQKVYVLRDAEGFVQCPQCQCYKARSWLSLTQHVKSCEEKFKDKSRHTFVASTESTFEESAQKLDDDVKVQGEEMKRGKDPDELVTCPQCHSYTAESWSTLMKHIKLCDEKYKSLHTALLVARKESSVAEGVQNLVQDGKTQHEEVKRPRSRSPAPDVSNAKRHKLDEQKTKDERVDVKASVSSSVAAASAQAEKTIDTKEAIPSTLESTVKVADVDPKPPQEASKLAITNVANSFPFEHDDLGDISASEKRSMPSGVFYNTLIRHIMPKYDLVDLESRAAVKSAVEVFLQEVMGSDAKSASAFLVGSNQETFIVPNEHCELFVEWIYPQLEQCFPDAVLHRVE
ncbi:hypothetical protein BJ741DRAFT_588953 [Chytriomyces cf. hyalinus JEL632]|nr:hypothetical protein BJ741DRAFT_588953 [Chytriomyces cf. hyalinus JEL632]